MELLERFAAGDLDAFESLFRQYQGDVYRWIVRIVRDPATAEDLTVETFWRIHRAHARFSVEGNFGGWLRRIATNAALDHLRRARREVPLPDDISASRQPDKVVNAEARCAIHQAISTLPPRLRVVILLAFIEEEPYSQIADALGISENAVKVRVFRGVRLLRKKLQQAGVHA
jgi:RNA polymerase sigma factor (sigma-70 family)